MKRTTENITSSQDVLMTEIIVNQALIDILIAKQLITEEELLKSIQKIKKEQQELQNNQKRVIPFQRRK